MSLGLTFQGTRQRSLFSFVRRPVPLPEALQTLQQRFAYLMIERGDNTWALRFCPTGYLEVQSAGDTVSGEVCGTPAGPGFHKAAVDFLTELQGLMGLRLTVEDETDYWVHRDFSRLQAEYGEWLTAVIETVVNDRRDECQNLVCWALDDWLPTEPAGVATPTGAFARASLKAGLAPDRFFIWWEADRGAQYCRGEALFLLWNEVTWVAPRFDAERAALEEVAALLARARELDQALPLPVAAWAEVLALLGENPDAATGPALPEEGPVGYRRHPISMPIGGLWRATLPGDGVQGEAENATYFWGQGWEFYSSIYRLAGQDRAKHMEWEGTPVASERDGRTYRGAWAPRTDGESEYWMLQGDVIAPGYKVLVTITWTDDEAQAEWAKTTFFSVGKPMEEVQG